MRKLSWRWNYKSWNAFLPDVYVPCEVCHGKRYNRETLQVKYKGKTIADVLDMTIEEASVFFENIPNLKSKLDLMVDVGIGYLKLGQSSTELSGGEAQRVKLALELSKKSHWKNNLYIRWTHNRPSHPWY